MAGYRFLLADADNTLFDFHAGERLALAQTLEAFSLPRDEETLAVYHRINEGLWRQLERGEITQAALRVRRFSDLLAELRLAGDAEAVAEHFIGSLGQFAIPLPGAEAAVRRWAKRVPIAIVTNGIAAVQRARIARSPIAAHIAALVISEEVGAAKPNPAMVHAALAALGCEDPAQALLLGDSPEADIAAANNARIASCWFNPTGAPCPASVRPTHIIASLDEVDALL